MKAPALHNGTASTESQAPSPAQAVQIHVSLSKVLDHAKGLEADAKVKLERVTQDHTRTAQAMTKVETNISAFVSETEMCAKEVAEMEARIEETLKKRKRAEEGLEKEVKKRASIGREHNAKQQEVVEATKRLKKLEEERKEVDRWVATTMDMEMFKF